MLWDNVFTFYVKYIFGGSLLENGVYYNNYRGILGTVYNSVTNNNVTLGTSDTLVFESLTFGPYSMSIGNYLSFIATIITMVAILLFCVFIVKKIIGIIFRLFTGSSAF